MKFISFKFDLAGSCTVVSLVSHRSHERKYCLACQGGSEGALGECYGRWPGPANDS